MVGFSDKIRKIRMEDKEVWVVKWALGSGLTFLTLNGN